MISTDPIFSAAGAADPGPGNAGHVLARRNQENVEIRPSELARITMLDQPDEIARKIRKAKTDPDALPDTVEALEARPEAANLLGIYAALADKPVAAAVDEFAARNFPNSKKRSLNLRPPQSGRLVPKCNA